MSGWIDLTNGSLTRISIVMAAYNAEKTIRMSIDSVIRQTYPHWELIVVDDGSQDATVQIVKSFMAQESRIKLHVNERNQGVSFSRNQGISYAKGEWIAFLDSDDCWLEDKLDKQQRFNVENNAEISYTSTVYINEAGVISQYILRAERKIAYSALLKRNPMSCSSVMVHRNIITQMGFVSGNLSEDYATWMQILRRVKYAYGLDEPLLIYRMTRSSKSGKRVKSGIMTYHAYRRVGYGCFFALLLTLRYALYSLSKHTLIRLGRLPIMRKNK